MSGVALESKSESRKNRAIVYVKKERSAQYTSIAGLTYLSKDGRYAVRMIFEIGVSSCDYTAEDVGIYVEKVE